MNGKEDSKLPKRAPSPSDLALAPPVELGTILFSLVEPRPGHAKAFADWYERDHFFAGCMAGADFFSGRRFVATRDLKRLRHGAGITPDEAPHCGSFLHLYWILKGRREPALEWSVDQVRRLARQGRMGPPTDSIATGFYNYAGCLQGANAPLAAELALEYPFRSTMVVLIEQAAGARDSDVRQTCAEALGFLFAQSRTLALWFTPLPLPANAPRIAAHPTRNELEHGRLMLVFSDIPANSRDWHRSSAAIEEALRSFGLGKLKLSAPFRPIVPGIDDYSDKL